MSLSPEDVLNKKKSLNKRIDIENIKLDDVNVDDLKFNGNNYNQYINLVSLLENVSACQISDAYNSISKRSGTIQSIKSINNKLTMNSENKNYFFSRLSMTCWRFLPSQRNDTCTQYVPLALCSQMSWSKSQ